MVLSCGPSTNAGKFCHGEVHAAVSSRLRSIRATFLRRHADAAESTSSYCCRVDRQWHIEAPPLHAKAGGCERTRPAPCRIHRHHLLFEHGFPSVNGKASCVLLAGVCVCTA